MNHCFYFFLEWDSDTASFQLLLHILPPQPSKKKKLKISATQAMDHLVVFHKVCARLQFVIFIWLVSTGHWKALKVIKCFL